MPHAILELIGKLGILILDLFVKEQAKNLEMKKKFLESLAPKDNPDSLKVYTDFRRLYAEGEDKRQ